MAGMMGVFGREGTAMNTAHAVELEYVIRRSTGFINALNTVAYNVDHINIGPHGHVYDFCDCHNMVWNAADLTYLPGPDSYVCPPMVDDIDNTMATVGMEQL